MGNCEDLKYIFYCEVVADTLNNGKMRGYRSGYFIAVYLRIVKR